MRGALLFIPIILLPLLFSCNNEQGSGLTEITIDEAELILSAETDSDMANPAIIRTVDSGFYLYDFGQQKILHYNHKGTLLHKFGEEGQGPEEFQGLGGFWIFDDEIAGFDQRGAKFLYFNRDGKFLREQQVNQDHFAPGLTMVDTNRFYIPLNGKDGALAKYIDKSSGQAFSFGDAEFDEVDFDAGTIRQSIERGNLPNYMLNRVSVTANQSRAFLFHRATGKLQAYDNAGTLAAETVLNLPFFKKIKEEFFVHSRSALEQGFFIHFSYIHSMIPTENGLLLLLNVPIEHPIVVLHLDNSLKNKTAYYYNSEKFSRVSMFDINEESNNIYFVSPGTSEIFRAPLGL